ncbi:alpha/beta hydrolase [Paenibacillus sp. RC67]|uniref:alpha/beta hydrolase n=1 Tax=Paenibacillus sp. RC67 TaxID=3039392 RepID=UPI0024AC8490|nr:alpha/beta hydrolase [Paenibacillus sp. RC67]
MEHVANEPCTIVRGVLYLGPDRKEQMDVYLPAGAEGERFPCIIIFHTDGRGGSRHRNKKAEIATSLVANGYVTMLAETAAALHSVANWNEGLVVPGWPNNLYDCKTAVRYAKKLAGTYPIDPERIGIIGGHLALLAAFTAKHPVMNQGGLYKEYSSEVKCVVNLYGITDLLSWKHQSYEGIPLGTTASEQAHQREEIDYVSLTDTTGPSGDVSPMLIVHGNQDSETDDVDISEDFMEQLKETNLARQFVAAGSTTGEDSGTSNVDLRPVILRFLDNNLKVSG